MKLLVALLFITTSCFAQTGDTALKSVDLIIHNAKIVSGPYTPTFSAMVVNHGKIIAMFKNDSWKKEFHSKTVLDMQKKVVLPGFIDAHCHFLGLGKAMDEVSLWGCKSWEETVERLVAFVKLHPYQKWIQGRGWDQNNWTHKEFPNKHLLDSLFSDKYIVLSRVDGHAVIANSKALNYAGIAISTSIEGGKLIEQNGVLTGVLVDNATQLVELRIPKPNKDQKIKWLLAAQVECLKYGITQVTDAGLSMSDILLIDSLCAANVLKLRFYLMANPEPETWKYLDEYGPFANKNVKWQSIKIYSDGALGSRGALLKKAYCDDKANYGLQLIHPMRLDSVLQICYLRGLQACTHAIGDSANAMVLKAYAKYLKTTTNDLRWRIEHAQVIDTADLLYFKTYSIIPSVQPTHATSDMDWAKARLCDPRMIGAYSYKSLLENSSFMVLGTDFPVEGVSPLNTIRSARFRQNADGQPKDGFRLNEGLSSQETFAGMSLWAAKGNFWETLTGTLEVGKFADFIVLDKDPYKANLEELNALKIHETYTEGHLAFKYFKTTITPDF